MSSIFPYSRQQIDKSDIDRVKSVLRSDYLTQGPEVKIFENKLSKFTGSKYVSVVNSATSALYIACKVLNLKKGDYAWTTPNTFVSSANCIIHCGAKIDFVDINEKDFNIDIDLLEKKLKNTKKNKLPKIIIPIHFAGCPYDQEKLFNLSKKYNFKIIEDASHAIGASNKKNKVGNCKWSNIVVFSFHPVKIITTGEGGALLTNEKKLQEKIQILRSHGITRELKFMKRPNPAYWYYEQQELSFNFRMPDINAALGSSQLKKISYFINYRNYIAKFYKKKLKDLPLVFQVIKKGLKSSYHLFVIKLLNKNNIKNYEKIFSLMRSKGILVNLHYLPVHKQPYYKNLKYLKNKNFKISENYSKSSMSLPIYPRLKKKNIIFIINTLRRALNKFKN